MLALLRPVDHDESQYVAAAVLTAHGLMPYRDFAYLQTPLQPYLFAGLAWAGGIWTWPLLRIANALLGAAAIVCVHRASRAAGAGPRIALAAAALFGCCDILLFSIGTARNDALPAACLAGAIWLAMRPQARARAATIGLLLAAAAAAKISYAFPAAGYGLYALLDRRRHPGWVALGAAPVLGFVAWTAWASPAGFLFGVYLFPKYAPLDYYAGNAWKLSATAKAVDTLKFLALGPALLALAVVVRHWRRPTLLDWLIVAGLVAALLPLPTWRQYLLPVLPPLFVRLAQMWEAHRPRRAVRIAAVVFACAGLAPSVAALGMGGALVPALADGRAVGAALDRAGVTGPVATLSPELLPAARRAPDPRFAAGPFYFRSTGLHADEAALHLVSQASVVCALLPAAILTGGEDVSTSGNPALDRLLDANAARRGYAPQRIGRLRLWIRPPALAWHPPAAGNRP